MPNTRAAWSAVHQTLAGDRRRLSASLMAGGVVAATVGAWVQWGVGLALLVLAGLCIALALIVGWE